MKKVLLGEYDDNYSLKILTSPSLSRRTISRFGSAGRTMSRKPPSLRIMVVRKKNMVPIL